MLLIQPFEAAAANIRPWGIRAAENCPKRMIE
jgi:hypothetical protein